MKPSDSDELTSTQSRSQKHSCNNFSKLCFGILVVLMFLLHQISKKILISCKIESAKIESIFMQIMSEVKIHQIYREISRIWQLFFCLKTLSLKIQPRFSNSTNFPTMHFKNQCGEFRTSFHDNYHSPISSVILVPSA